MLTLQEVTKLYQKDGQTIRAVDQLSWQVPPGALAVVHGKSGSGKSTLLMMIGGMLNPTRGRITFHDRDLYALSRAARNRFRKESVGFVFQRFHLLPYFTIAQNIGLALAMKHVPDGPDRIRRLAAQLDLTDRLNHYPDELSVGQQQRVAVARALVGEPDLVLADEPTGNLDRENAALILDQLRSVAAAGKIVIAATHDDRLLAHATHRLHLTEGRGVAATQLPSSMQS